MFGMPGVHVFSASEVRFKYNRKQLLAYKSIAICTQVPQTSFPHTFEYLNCNCTKSVSAREIFFFLSLLRPGRYCCTNMHQTPDEYYPDAMDVPSTESVTGNAADVESRMLFPSVLCRWNVHRPEQTKDTSLGCSQGGQIPVF
uniref:Uncharacterized protein n=1 Tax=Eutreptiella gymnastica TaxID=73025 RepID=A0A7S4LF70_9EUGL